MAVIKRVRLSEIAELVTKGTTPTTLGYEFQDTGVNFLKIECFSEKGDYIQNKATHISEECHEKLKRSQLKEGDILFSIAGVIGRVAIVTRNMLPANINQALAIIRIKKDDIYLPYVKLILTSPLIKKQFERKKQGVAQLNISLKDINDLEIPLPEISKQIEYANSFKKVEKLIYTRQYQLQKLDELVKARFVEMFGDRYVNDKNWNTTKLGNSISFNNGKAHEQIVDENGEYILVTSRAIASNFKDVRRTNELLSPLRKDDIVMVMSDVPNGRALAKCQLIKDNNKYTLNQRICSFDNYNYNPVFLLFLLSRHPYFLSFNDGNGQTNLRKNDILDCELIDPPIELQEQFADFVSQVDKSKVAVQKSLDEAQLLFDSLMQQYFG